MTRHQAKIVLAISSITSTICFIVLTGYVTGIKELTNWFGDVPMAIPTSVVCLAQGIATSISAWNKAIGNHSSYDHREAE